MKKITFAVQVFLLAASFPVLFIAGISHPKSKTAKPGSQPQPVTVTKNQSHKQVCLCNTGGPLNSAQDSILKLN